MKRFAALALILSIGLFTIGCAESKTKPKKPADKPAAESADKADKDAKDAKPAADAKTDAKKEAKK